MLTSCRRPHALDCSRASSLSSAVCLILARLPEAGLGPPAPLFFRQAAGCPLGCSLGGLPFLLYYAVHAQLFVPQGGLSGGVRPWSGGIFSASTPDFLELVFWHTVLI